MRVKDPFDDIDLGKRKAVLYTACIALLLVAYTMVFPTQAALIGMILAFFVMIMLHEFGHFTMAKRADMKVTEFFVGFGPRLWTKTKGETEYGVKAIPLGGYCKVIGMTNLDDIAPEDEPRTYRSKTWFQKVRMAAAGPAVHFMIAGVLIFCVLFFAGDYRAQKLTTTLSDVSAGAAAAHLQKGDQIIAIDNQPVKSWNDVHTIVAGPKDHPRVAGDTVSVEYQRGGVVNTVNVTLQTSTDSGPKRVVVGIAPQVSSLPHPGVLAAVAESPKQEFDIGWSSLKAVGTMFSPSGIANYFHILSGDKSKSVNQDQRFVSPVGFGQLANDAVKAGWVDALGLLIAINIFVGLFNLLPLLPFDGGHIAVASYEAVMSKIRRRRVQVDFAKLMPVMVAVFAIFGFIAISSLFLDITNPVKSPF